MYAGGEDTLCAPRVLVRVIVHDALFHLHPDVYAIPHPEFQDHQRNQSSSHFPNLISAQIQDVTPESGPIAAADSTHDSPGCRSLHQQVARNRGETTRDPLYLKAHTY